LAQAANSELLARLAILESYLIKGQYHSYKIYASSCSVITMTSISGLLFHQS